MAKECNDSLVTPEKNGLDVGNTSRNSTGDPDSLSTGRTTLARHRRASIGSYHAGDRPLRNSADGSQVVVPNYLRASTGSCHDFCKYGREHTLEKKERKPLRKRIAKPLPNEPFSADVLVLDDRKKEKVVDHGPSTDARNNSPEQADVKSFSTKSKSSLDKDKVMKNKPFKDEKHCSPDVPSQNTKSYIRNPKIVLDVKMHSSKDNDSSGNGTVLPKKLKMPSSTKKLPAAHPPEIVKGVIFPSTEVEDSVKQGTLTEKKLLKAEKNLTTNVSQHHSSPIKSKPVKVKPSSSSENSDGIHRKGIRSSNAKIGKSVIASKAPAKKVLVAPAATVSPKLFTKKITPNNSGKIRNLKSVLVAPVAATTSPKLSMNKVAHNYSAGKLKKVPHLKEQDKIQGVEESNHEKAFEKTLHVIEKETENNVSQSIPVVGSISSLPSPSSAESLSFENSSSSSYHEEGIAETDQSGGEADETIPEEDNVETEQSGEEADEVITDNSVSQETVKVPLVKENHSKTLRKSRVVASDVKFLSPVKLKFRSGKVVDLQSDNNSPRRLRFRRARIQGAQDSKGDTRRTLRKAGTKDDSTGAEVSSEKVVLKRQDVQGKKDAQGLFNNVIEETASKLVESRKSKVKALVGAFETVISLQESKPSQQVS